MLLLEQQYQLFAFNINREGDINLPIERLYSLLTTKESAMDVPSNLEAKRCISFFYNSLYMDMSIALKVRNMLSFSYVFIYFCS